MTQLNLFPAVLPGPRFVVDLDGRTIRDTRSGRPVFKAGSRREAADVRHRLENGDPPPPRLKPSDPEIWKALMHPEGGKRLRALMVARHGADHPAIVRELEDFLPPTRYRDAPCEMGGSGGHWPGWIHLVHREFGGRPPGGSR